MAIFVIACSGGAPQEDLSGSVKVLSEADTLLFVDQRGTLLSETDGLGKPTGEFNALPFGIARTDTATETRKYAGAPRDTGIGLDAMGARFYAPDLGIWTSSDPVHFTDPERLVSSDFTSANPYAYANQTPIIGVDEDGEWMHIAAGAAIGALWGGGMEAASQYLANGKVTDWGKVGSAAVGGGVSGAITAAFPGGGTLAKMGVEATANVAGGMTTRLIDSGGKSVGSLKEVAADAIVLPGGGGKKKMAGGGKVSPPHVSSGGAGVSELSAKVGKGGRTGKQQRLRQLAGDPNTARADRGWIKQEMNSIARGKRTSIRNPPGKELAHTRGREAAKGYDHLKSPSNLQDADLHKTQHKFDDFGRLNKEKPD